MITTAVDIGVFVLGTIVGSFLNVVAFRYNTGRGLSGRSSCSACGTTLGWRELVPIASFLIRRGRCARCRARISRQYPLVECATGIVFLAAHLATFSGAFDAHYFATMLWYAVFSSLLLVITVYDIRHTIIPDGLVYATAALGIVAAFVVPGAPPIATALASGALSAAPFAFLFWVSRGRWMGFGDAKLAFAVGVAIGANALSAFVLAFWMGALWGLAALALQHLPLFHRTRRFTLKSEVPFAPFIVLGALAVLFSGFDILTLSYAF